MSLYSFKNLVSIELLLCLIAAFMRFSSHEFFFLLCAWQFGETSLCKFTYIHVHMYAPCCNIVHDCN